jgi:hypothetical protein
MKKREPVSISFCEKCGNKVSSRDEVCSSCRTLPIQDDRRFKSENNIPEDSYIENWSEELQKKCFDWVDTEPIPKYCKDCGMDLNEVSKYDGESEIDDWGHVITPNNHPCNPNSPIFE